MLKWMNNTLVDFKDCFSRKATFCWYVIIVLGLMFRSEHLGVTSIIRELNINPKNNVYFKNLKTHLNRNIYLVICLQLLEY